MVRRRTLITAHTPRTHNVSLSLHQLAITRRWTSRCQANGVSQLLDCAVNEGQSHKSMQPRCAPGGLLTASVIQHENRPLPLLLVYARGLPPCLKRQVARSVAQARSMYIGTDWVCRVFHVPSTVSFLLVLSPTSV